MSVYVFNDIKIVLCGLFFLLLIFNVIFNFMEDKVNNNILRKHLRPLSTYENKKINTSQRTGFTYLNLIKNTTLSPYVTVLPSKFSQTISANFISPYEVPLKEHDYLLPNTSLHYCENPTENSGPITPNITFESLDIVENELATILKPGGAFKPKECISKHNVAIIVPFRDRYAHLSVFLRNIHPFLMKQKIAYRIFVVEQTNGKPFNRAALMNIGYLEALKVFPCDCFIFHDVDLLPLDNRNIYNCPRQPRHMSVAIDNLNFKLPYQSIFGGVSAMSKEHFQAVNGFSNSFFGWGGEDDDMSNRIKNANLFISRYPINIARYMMLKHQKEKANPKRYENLINGVGKFKKDGLNSMHYEVYSMREFPAFTWYLIDLKIIIDKNINTP